ncbi:orotidine-5'-phosphate decarboxylase [Aliidiomarina soli]|uniref:Orotidine 5'-phosphate decarboxylase n=1 Tax=Aliidiomarina soli TaxID=1928574 RepID=A0A432WMR6_9GAMM|nr:orotidine-5'-phosphate decarboxylase [Aliidiomarina soli]RUO35021.1 orotidine-5'-phosphate decarboxylase [Aliidiomarina soli]
MNKVIVALDYAQADEALTFVKTLNSSLCRVKVGKELFTSAGPALIHELHRLGFEVFLDLKFHDIPATVAKAVAAAAQLGVWMVNVHASGGEEMMKAAASALQPFADSAPKLIAVTVLTSMSEKELHQLGVQRSLQEHVRALAKLSKDCGLDGVVCSAQEAADLRRELGSDFLLVTPGIRPQGSQADDQKRVMTPKQAIDAGVSYLVMGRPIRHADDPVAALHAVNQSIAG